MSQNKYVSVTFPHKIVWIVVLSIVSKPIKIHWIRTGFQLYWKIMYRIVLFYFDIRGKKNIILFYVILYIMYLSISLFICQYFVLYICHSVYPYYSVHRLSIHHFICMSVIMSICYSVYRQLSMNLSVFLFFFLFIFSIVQESPKYLSISKSITDNVS